MAAWFGAAVGWAEPTFRAFYLLGAILNVPVLAVGTIYLLGGRRIGDRAAAVVALGSAFAIGVLWTAPMHGELGGEVLPRGSEVFGVLPRVLAAAASTSGAIVVGLGAILSLWRLRGVSETDRGKVKKLALGNCLVALAIVALSTGGAFNSIASEMTIFSVSLTVGAVLLFAGFMVIANARDNPTKKRSSEVESSASGEAPGTVLSTTETRSSSELNEDVDEGGDQDGGEQDSKHNDRPSSH